VRGTPRWEARIAAGERPIEGEEVLNPSELAEEALLLGLRTTTGVDLDAFRSRYGVDLLAANAALVERLVDEGRLVMRADPGGGRRLAPTVAGLAVADGLAAAFDLALPR
jgi:oxygen-independent coproporphyrinogen-3 oxidase